MFIGSRVVVLASCASLAGCVASSSGGGAKRTGEVGKGEFASSERGGTITLGADGDKYDDDGRKVWIELQADEECWCEDAQVCDYRVEPACSIDVGYHWDDNAFTTHPSAQYRLLEVGPGLTVVPAEIGGVTGLDAISTRDWFYNRVLLVQNTLRALEEVLPDAGTTEIKGRLQAFLKAQLHTSGNVADPSDLTRTDFEMTMDEYKGSVLPNVVGAPPVLAQLAEELATDFGDLVERTDPANCDQLRRVQIAGFVVDVVTAAAREGYWRSENKIDDASRDTDLVFNAAISTALGDVLVRSKANSGGRLNMRRHRQFCEG